LVEVAAIFIEVVATVEVVEVLVKLSEEVVVVAICTCGELLNKADQFHVIGFHHAANVICGIINIPNTATAKIL
jgi:hypothetical protein